MARGDLHGRRWLPPLGIAGLVLLTILDVVLVTLAFRHVETPAPSEAEGATSATDGSRSPAPSEPAGSGPADASGSVRLGPALPDGPLLLALAPDGTLLRASAAPCEDASDPQVAVAGPGARSFRPVTVAADLGAVWALEARGRDDLVVIGAGADCAPTSYRGGVRGRSWTTGSPSGAWYLDPGDDGSVHAPGGPVEVPCSPAALSTRGAIRLLCDDGTLLGTSDAGASWVPLGRVDRADAIAFDGPGRGLALASRRTCRATVLVTADGGAAWETAACLEGATGLAVALLGETAVAYVDDTLWRSTDGGKTWEPAA